MDPFDEWAKSSTQHISVQTHADRLIELGASWDTFLSRDPSAIAQDLVQGGIPLLAARDIVDVARVAARQSQAPMAVFWDLENMPIPTTSSGRDVSSRLKSILKPYGALVQFRGYASLGLNLIPQQKRSDLQLSGCLLIDCPHNGRKEVADKMIIVDAMNFAMENPNGATLCFITGDVDYAYLLAVLQRYKQYRTIVISKGTLQSMLDVNCDMKMRWETDILQLRSTPAWNNTRTVQVLGLSSHDTATGTPDEANNADNTAFEPLTAQEEWIDDAEFLRNLIRHKGVSTVGSMRKSLVGNLLRQTNPARFPNREAVQNFLVKAIEKGVILEKGEGAFKEIGLPTDETTGMFPAISLSAHVPMPLQDIPKRAITAAATRSYIIFMKWKFCPPGTNLPSAAFVQHKDAWGIFMFVTLTDAQRTVSEFPWLRNGILVDWRKVNNKDIVYQNKSLASSTGAAMASNNNISCTFCRAIRIDVQLQQLENGSGFACPECIAWETTTSLEEKTSAAAKVVDFLSVLARNDDIKVSESILRRQLHGTVELDCHSRKWAALWIRHAIETGFVKSLGGGSSKSKSVCLACRFQEASRSLPPADFDTTAEEQHVIRMLWDRPGGWADRMDIIEALKQAFPTRMSHPFMRGKVLLNASQKNRIFLAKDSYHQVVGLTQKDAEDALESMRKQQSQSCEKEVLEEEEQMTIEDSSVSKKHEEDIDDDINDNESDSDNGDRGYTLSLRK